jgi:hypothetical protein
MSSLQVTPEGRSPGDGEDGQPDRAGRDTYDEPDPARQVADGGDGGDDDALRRAEAARLQRYELERAADEGMTEPPDEDTRATEALSAAPNITAPDPSDPVR